MSNAAASSPAYLRHDYLETPEGLFFAVVENGVECGRALCFLRYLRSSQNWRKLNTAEANELLAGRYPTYLFHSPRRDAALHGVPVERVMQSYTPRTRAAELLAQAADAIESKARAILTFLIAQGVPAATLGVTGSLLIGAQTPDSDIDLVVYGQGEFQTARQALLHGIETGEFLPLSPQQWEASWRRRGCALTLDEYIWHERRKGNKAIVDGRKFDISQASDHSTSSELTYRKLGARSIVARVTRDDQAFAFPACWAIDDPEIDHVVSFTPTYFGQAKLGEVIQANGQLEQSSDGTLRLAVGTNREAHGEWIKVRR